MTPKLGLIRQVCQTWCGATPHHRPQGPSTVPRAPRPFPNRPSNRALPPRPTPAPPNDPTPTPIETPPSSGHPKELHGLDPTGEAPGQQPLYQLDHQVTPGGGATHGPSARAVLARAAAVPGCTSGRRGFGATGPASRRASLDSCVAYLLARVTYARWGNGVQDTKLCDQNGSSEQTLQGTNAGDDAKYV